MARFVREGVTLHVYADGKESNIGVFEGVDSIYFHEGVLLRDVVFPGIEAKHLYFNNNVDCFTSLSLYDRVFYGVESIDVFSYPSLIDDVTGIDDIIRLVMGLHYYGKEDPILENDLTVRRWRRNGKIPYVATFSKGTTQSIVNWASQVVFGYYNQCELLTYENRKNDSCEPLFWIDLFFALEDVGKDDDESRKYVRRHAGTAVKKHFSKASDATIIRLIREDLLTKAMMLSLLGMANDSGRVDVVAEILEKAAPKRNVVSKFAI